MHFIQLGWLSTHAQAVVLIKQKESVPNLKLDLQGLLITLSHLLMISGVRHSIFCA